MENSILVTGGSGFIGSHLVDLLISNGFSVYVIDDLSTGLKNNQNDAATYIYKDITDFINYLNLTILLTLTLVYIIKLCLKIVLF